MNTPRQILFADDSESSLQSDLINFYAYIDSFTAALGIVSVPIDPNKCAGVVAGIRKDFPCINGLAGASPFKKVANFVSHFVAARPLPDAFGENNIGQNLSRIENHQNAMVALSFALDALHLASIKRKDGEQKLNNKIVLSKHSYVDIIEAISDATPSTHFRLLSVLFEQMAYKNNIHCQYSDVIA